MTPSVFNPHAKATEALPQGQAAARWASSAWLLSPRAWTAQTGWYLAYRVADYMVLNLGEDAAMVAFVFC